jgi:hypothetical protein
MLIILFLSHRRFIVVGHHLRLGWRVGIFFFLSRTKPKNKEKTKKSFTQRQKLPAPLQSACLQRTTGQAQEKCRIAREGER